MDPHLTTERLALRRSTEHDADLVVELDSDPAVMRYLTGGAPGASEDVVREQVRPGLLAASSGPEVIPTPEDGRRRLVPPRVTTAAPRTAQCSSAEDPLIRGREAQ